MYKTIRQWSSTSKGMVIIYGALLAVLILVVKYVEWRYFRRDIAVEIYVGLIATLFTILGIWIGSGFIRKNIPKKPDTKKVDTNRISSLGISKREHEILLLIAQGLSNQEIADRLFISLPTVKSHASSLYNKLKVKRRSQAIAEAKSLNIIPL